MAIDFFGVKLTGRIKQFVAGSGTGPGKTVELWTTPQDSALSTADQLGGALAFVSEINVVYKMGENCSISLVLTPPFENALAFMQSELIRQGAGRLEVELGYSTGTFSGDGATAATMLPFSGLLMKPDVSIGSDITITLHAQGVGYQMNVVGGTETELFPENTSYADAVKQTLERHITTDGASSNIRITDLYKHIPDPVKDPDKGDEFFRIPKANSVTNAKSDKPDAKVVPSHIHKGPKNDWWFVRETVNEFGYDLFIEGNELFIVEKTGWFVNSFSQRKPRKHFKLRGAVDPTLHMYPILSFSSPTDGVWMQPGVGRMIAHDVDANKKEDKFYESSPDTETIGRGKESADPSDLIDNLIGILEKEVKIGEEQTRIADTRAAMLMPGDPSDPEVKKRMRGHWLDMQLQSGIGGQFTTLGIPSLTPGEVVQVTGFEPLNGAVSEDKALFNGPYGVTEVTHKIGVGGWETSFFGTMNFFPENSVKAYESIKKAKQESEDKETDAIIALYTGRNQQVSKKEKLKAKIDGVTKIPKKEPKP